MTDKFGIYNNYNNNYNYGYYNGGYGANNYANVGSQTGGLTSCVRNVFDVNGTDCINQYGSARDGMINGASWGFTGRLMGGIRDGVSTCFRKATTFLSRGLSGLLSGITIIKDAVGAYQRDRARGVSPFDLTNGETGRAIATSVLSNAAGAVCGLGTGAAMGAAATTGIGATLAPYAPAASAVAGGFCYDQVNDLMHDWLYDGFDTSYPNQVEGYDYIN